MTWNPIQEIETEFGVIKVDVNVVIAKAITRVQLVEHELTALIQWGAAHETQLAAGLTAAAPIISEIGVIATTAVTGNPAAGSAVAAGLTLVNKAMGVAQAALVSMNAAGNALKISQAAGNGALVNNTTAVAAAVTATVHASASVTAITTAAITAASLIQSAARTASPTSVLAQVAS